MKTAMHTKQSKENALRSLEEYSSHPSAFLALNKKTCHFTDKNSPGFIAYRPSGGYLFQLGSVFAPKERQAELLSRFRQFARSQNKRICALQLRAEDIPLYRDAGFRLNQLGRSYSVELNTFTTAGSKFTRLRNKVNRARKAGVEVVELGIDQSRSDHYDKELQSLTIEWLGSKGRFKKLLDFMVGELGGPHDSMRRVFLALKEDKVLGFISYVPVWGEQPGFMHDLSRRSPDAPPGVMELINVTALDRFKNEGTSFLHFGLTPFMGCGMETDIIEGRSKVVSWLLMKLSIHGKAIYPAQSQAQYKLKWKPGVIVPEYVAYQGRFRLSCLLRLLMLTRSI
ncbi:MAG: DUF2156 domain-containing protein [Planctomycetota bacterium]|nr:DUF2156 domain-containing protein [Planctomycetota bacterium]